MAPESAGPSPQYEKVDPAVAQDMALASDDAEQRVAAARQAVEKLTTTEGANATMPDGTKGYMPGPGFDRAMSEVVDARSDADSATERVAALHEQNAADQALIASAQARIAERQKQLDQMTNPS